jgi:hypothetical protein
MCGSGLSSNGNTFTSGLMKIGQLIKNLKFIRTCRNRKVNSRASSTNFRKENAEMTEK